MNCTYSAGPGPFLVSTALTWFIPMRNELAKLARGTKGGANETSLPGKAEAADLEFIVINGLALTIAAEVTARRAAARMMN